MNATARWSSSSGWLGGWPAAPKLSGVGTSPRPNRCSQTRLTITRAVSGLSGRREPVGQLQPAARRRRIVGGVFGVSTCGEAARHDLARLVELAADVERAVDRPSPRRGRPSPAASACPSASYDVELALRACAIRIRRRRSRAGSGRLAARFGGSSLACGACDLLLDRCRVARPSSGCDGRRLAGVRRAARAAGVGVLVLDDADACRSTSRCCGRCRPGRSSPAAGSGRTCGRGSGRRRRSARGTPAWSRRSARRPRPARTASRFRSLSVFGPMARKPVAISCSACCLRRRRRQQVAGELLLDEPVERLVGVERGDDVVAVPPGVRVGEVHRACRSISAYRATSSQCRPQRSPNARRRQQPVDHLLERARATSSATNASTSSGVGGRPVRSK